ncbi:D-alanine--D-alanyl carrier protein ligase [Paraburkholderia caffeinitolerans]|uniref:D-alanine--D-alanyl carrier protein ligase n=1 Tax=Paraburkholderia caffeinitolerans TaxID=1723730 RepID=A0A6J5GG97_9BURK|nr:AMP-binding protein [Paraburkholderia caffeinitolerans]CAB3798695.1 D-alanine--D-alanyl carrier protein ligase [Paraburkholderia caffeinitolerans]
MIALHELLVAPRRETRDAVCIDGANVKRFAAFRARALGIAARARRQPGERFVLWSDDPYAFACALFGLLSAGKVPVIPANPTSGYLAELRDAYDAVLDDGDLAAWCADAGAPSHDEPDELDEHAGAIDANASLTLFTSGSSGAPKAVHKTLAQFDAEVRTLEAEWGALLGDASVLASVPHHHIYGLLFRVFWPLAAGRAFDRATCADPLQLRSRIAQCGAAVVVSTPAQLSRWPDLPGFAALSPAPRAFFSSGGPLPFEAAQRYADTFAAAPLEVYGSTETGGIAWRRQSETDAWTPMRRIAVRAGAAHEGGALEVRSPHLGHDGWHRTDDKAVFDERGRFRLQGRLDRVVKLDGKRVSLGEIESRLLLHPCVAEARTVLLEGGSRQRIGALVVLSAQGHETLQRDGRVQFVKALRRHLAAWFDAVVLPRHWRIHRALPVDARGKVQAQAVARAFAAREEGFELLAEWDEAQGRAFELRVPPALVHFAGHFPGLPILPGVVQVDWTLRFAREWVPGLCALASVEQLKFAAPVPPGAVLKLTLMHDAARRRVSFAWRLGERGCASGVIVYREAA